MSAGLAEALGLVQDGFVLGALVFFRVGAAMFLLPAFGEQSVPQRVRLAAALAFTVIVAPALADAMPLRGGPSDLLRAFIHETVIGLAIGLGLRMLLITLQVAGTIAAQATSLSQFFGGVNVDPQPAISQFLVVAGLALAVAGDLHVKVAALFIYSYQILPMGQMPNAADLSHWGVAQIATSFARAFSLAAPFIIAAVIYNVAIGIINRAMPQLMVAFVGAPALTFGGLALLLITAPMVLSLWSRDLDLFLVAPFAVQP